MLQDEGSLHEPGALLAWPTYTIKNTYIAQIYQTWINNTSNSATNIFTIPNDKKTMFPNLQNIEAF